MTDLIVIVLLCGAVAAMFAAYWNVLRKLKAVGNHEGLLREKARLRSEKILDDARERAMQIVRESKMLSEEQSEELEKKWGAVVKKVSQDFEAGAESEIKGFRKTLEMEAVGAERAVAGRIEQEFAEAKVQIEEYKKSKLARLDTEIVEIVNETVKSVVGKVIPMEEHKKLIISALEEAKREHIL